MDEYGKIFVVVGLQYGDEGKGKIAATLPRIYDITTGVRAGVGPNAGHSVMLNNGNTVEFRTIPECAVSNKVKKLMIGPGTLVDPEILQNEVEELRTAGLNSVLEKVVIDANCGIVEPRHRDMERGYLQQTIGSMVSGCGAKSIERIGRDISKWVFPRDIAYLRGHIGNVPQELFETLMRGENIVVSGTQGFGLSLYHGTYPYVTSKDTTASQCLADAGIGPGWDITVVGCVKPYTTRAGTGPIPNKDDSIKHVEEKEIRPGVVIGSDRRVGNFDMDLVKRAIMANGIVWPSYLALTNIDRLWPENAGKTKVKELSYSAQKFIDNLETETNAPVRIISNGPHLDDFILK